MENENLENIPQEEQAPEAPRYVPRPQWQVWAARIGLVAFLIFLVMYYLIFFRGV